jgi:hypothetical protein
MHHHQTNTTVFIALVSGALLEDCAAKEVQMAADDVANLESLREIVRQRRRKLVAAMVASKKGPTKFSPLVEIQEACDAIEWALEDEIGAARTAERPRKSERQ